MGSGGVLELCPQVVFLDFCGGGLNSRPCTILCSSWPCLNHHQDAFPVACMVCLGVVRRVFHHTFHNILLSPSPSFLEQPWKHDGLPAFAWRCEVDANVARSYAMATFCC